MKRYYKLILPILLVLVMIFGSCATAYANIMTGIAAFCNLFHSLENGEIENLLDFIDQTFQNSGLLGVKIPGDLQTLEQYIHENYPELEGETSEETQENVSDYLTSNISVSDNDSSYTFNDNSRDFFLNLSSYYVDLNEYYVLNSFDLSKTSNDAFWSDKTHLQAIKDLCQTYQNDYYMFYFGSNLYDGRVQLIIGLPKSSYGFCINKSGLASLIDKDMYFNAYGVNIDGSAIYGNPAPTGVKCWGYDSTNHVYNEGTWNKVTVSQAPMKFCLPKNNVYLGPAATMGTYWQNDTSNGDYTKYKGKPISVGYQEIILFRSFNTFADASAGVQPYYYNNQTWSSFSSSTGDYTVDNSNINTVTYGDVVSYVNDYHDTNNNYPDNSQVNTWIETTNNNNNGSGGGGSGGNGSGSEDDSTGIFDFLSKIGQVLGNLIKNLGSVLTDLIEGIAETISGLFESIPMIFGDFLGALLGWLPDELQALIILGISAMIIVGLIKVFRG